MISKHDQKEIKIIDTRQLLCSYTLGMQFLQRSNDILHNVGMKMLNKKMWKLVTNKWKEYKWEMVNERWQIRYKNKQRWQSPLARRDPKSLTDNDRLELTNDVYHYKSYIKQ